MKVGDRLIVHTWSRFNENVTTATIEKINKTTYTLSNKMLVYIETLERRQSRDVWSSDHTKILKFDLAQYNKIKNEIEESKYKEFKQSFEKNKYNVKFVKRYISELESKEEL